MNNLTIFTFEKREFLVLAAHMLIAYGWEFTICPKTLEIKTHVPESDMLDTHNDILQAMTEMCTQVTVTSEAKPC